MPTPFHTLRDVLANIVPSNQLTPQLLQEVQAAVRQDSDVDVDILREGRCGFPEVVYGEGKSADLILRILAEQRTAGQSSLVTRVTQDTAEVVLRQYPQAMHNAVGRTIRVAAEGTQSPAMRGRVIVVTAGSCDRPVAEEAFETLTWMNVNCKLIQDVGVAGPHRLLRHLDVLREADAIVCVAGMEAALPSVLGGHVSCPVIGVPTSVGYGATFGGVTALLAMMTCCASNVAVVNIDAGFKGAYVAGVIASRVAAARSGTEV